MSASGGSADLTPRIRQDLADWLLAVSDNKQLLGLRYAEWCTGAPELEADIAASAMAQYELGHARLIHGLLGGLEEDPRTVERQEDPGAWRCLPLLDHPFRSWVELVAANALVDTLLTVNMEAACGGDYRPLAQRLRKAVAEERYHFVHARAWFARIREGPEELVQQLHQAVGTAWRQCLAWFGPGADDGSLERLANAGVLDAGAAGLRERYLERVGPLVAGHPVAARETSEGWIVETEIDWDGWSDSSRRHGVPALDDDTFAMLTGAEARALGIRD